MAEQPMYRQIAEDLREKIESGAVPRGSQLPTELELREQYDASRNTIRDAIKLLISRGMVETRPGQGTFVVEKIDPFITTLSADPETGLGGGEGDAYGSEVTALGRTPSSTQPRVEIQQAVGTVAIELQLEEGTTVVSRHQRRYIDQTLWSLQTSFYPKSLVDRGAQKLMEASDITEGTVAYLRETVAHKAGRLTATRSLSGFRILTKPQPSSCPVTAAWRCSRSCVRPSAKTTSRSGSLAVSFLPIGTSSSSMSAAPRPRSILLIGRRGWTAFALAAAEQPRS